MTEHPEAKVFLVDDDAGVREALAGIDPDELTPKQALEALYALKKAASS
jgi:DNA mismatch repair protein MutS